MSEDELIIKLTVDSTPDTLLPALLPYLQHKYLHGDAPAAIDVLKDIFNDMVKPVGLTRILRGDNLPVWQIDDLMQDKLTFVFYPYELAKSAMKDIEDLQ